MTLCVCTPSRLLRDAPSVKGIYTALFILILSTSAFAQFELKDTSTAVPFHKWEVSFDLKPLFRSDEPYNILTKWHFTEKKAVRLGLGMANHSKTNDTFWIQETRLVNNQNVIQYQQYTRNNGKKMNWDIKLGYQYEFKQGKISIYAATDFDWAKESLDFHVPLIVIGQLIDQGAVQPFSGYQSIWLIRNRKTILGLIQSLGFKYNINNNLSCAFETSLIGQYIKLHYDTHEAPYLNADFTKFTIKGGHETQFSFKPLMGVFVNYHF